MAPDTVRDDARDEMRDEARNEMRDETREKTRDETRDTKPSADERKLDERERVPDDGSSEAVLDQAALDSFPASDPAAPGVPRKRKRRERDAAEGGRMDVQDALDEALEDTFPASDPLSVTQPVDGEREP